MEKQISLELRPTDALWHKADDSLPLDADTVLRLRASLREFGLIVPILTSGTGEVLAGFARLAAARAESWTEIPCVLLEQLTAEQLHGMILADVRLTQRTSWDDALVAQVVRELGEVGFPLGELPPDPWEAALFDG